jgi:hypothetical protein
MWMAKKDERAIVRSTWSQKKMDPMIGFMRRLIACAYLSFDGEYGNDASGNAIRECAAIQVVTDTPILKLRFSL